MVIYCFTVFLNPVEQGTINRNNNWLITQADASANTGTFIFLISPIKYFSATPYIIRKSIAYWLFLKNKRSS
jgi:hypothetical protein